MADHLDIFIHVRSKFPVGSGLWTILAEKLVESDCKGFVAPLFSFLADLTQTLVDRSVSC